MGKFEDLSGRQFGDWRVVSRSENRGSSTMWNCRCRCGALKQVSTSSLRLGRSTNCGCRKADKSRASSLKHGDSHTKLYIVWVAMKQRCTNPNSASYKNYGGRGISVCSEWKEYAPFKNWADSAGYRDGLTIERKDVHGNYCPENCEWIPRAQQGKNTTRTKNNRGDGYECSYYRKD